jgi:hypothetical protein
MPTPRLPLPQDVRLTALRGFIDILQRDPELKRVVRAWKVWDGRDGDATPPTGPECPWIRITATPEASSWAMDGPPPVMLQPMRVEIATAVAGTNADNSVNLWGAIERAVYRNHPAPLEAVGISGVEVKQPGWGQSDQDANGVDLILGVGVMILTIYVAAES